MELTRKQKWLMTGAATLGIAVGAGGIAGAATSSGSSSTGNTSAIVSAAAGQGPSGAPQRADETLLTGTTAEKVTAAAQAAVPDATIIRVETDADGAAYEAHMRKADGTQVTVTFDSSFKVIETVDGFGGRRG